MKKISKIFLVTSLTILTLVVTGCGKLKVNTPANDNGEQTKQIEQSKGKCKYYECLTKMKYKMSIDEVTKIIGIEPTKSKDTQYEYDFGDDRKITANTSSDGSIISIEVDYDKKELANKKVTLENLQDIKARINDGISYDEFKKAVGGVDGTLVEVGSWNKYVWVKADGSSYVTASFGNETGKLMFFSGFGR